MKSKFLIIAAALLCFFAAQGISAQNSNKNRAECFPFEKLSAAQRIKAEELLLKALDSEALYTIAGGLKPMSSGFQQFRVTVQLPRVDAAEAEKAVRELGAKKGEELTDAEKNLLSRAKTAVQRAETLKNIEETRLILAQWRCGDGEIFASLQHFARPFDGQRFADTVVFSRPRLRQMLTEKADVFSRWGITANAHPLDVLYAVEYDATSARNGGYGFLFGYPDYAVRFFVSAADEEEFSGKFVERDFYSIPTFAAATGNFVYAVPKNHVETEADRNLKVRAAQILESYKRRRSEYVGAGKKGVVEMLRDWFCTTNNRCLPGAAQ